MARIVCQVLHRSDRISFLWSEGAAAFEPYHLEGAERARLLELAGQTQVALAAGAIGAVATLGQQLYRTLFRLDSGAPGPAAAVHAWLVPLASGNQIERLEFLTDSPGLIAWNTLNEEGNAQQFWGARFSLGVGRRVNSLRQNPGLANPLPVLAADADLIERITDAQRPLLNPLRDAGRLWHSAAALEDALKKRVPDILLLLVRFDQGQLRLGVDAFTVADLQAWLDEAKEGNPDPIVILVGCGDPREQPAWQRLLSAATATFSGLSANETLLPPAQAFGIGYAVAQRLMEGKGTLGEILRSLRQEQPAAGLAFSAFCPPQVGVGGEASAETEIQSAPLPRLPYRPFAAYDAADRALFFGREEDVIRGALVTDQAATNGVFLHGSPAVGKTSYLQAGLLPYLEQECVGYRVLRDRSPLETPVAEKDYPILILRCTSDLAGQFADALTVFCAQRYTYTTPAGTQVSIDLPNLLQFAVTGKTRPSVAGSTAFQASDPASAIVPTPDQAEALSPRDLWIALRDNKSLLARILDTITRALPFELVVAVDQGEDLLTLVRTPQQQVRRRKALDMLMQLTGAAARCKIVYTLRSQCLAQLDSLLPAGRAPADWQAFQLRPLTEGEMVDALQWPTHREEIPYCDEIPHQKYRFAFEAGVAQQIVAEAIETAAAAGHSPLPILQAVGALLYDKQVLGKGQQIVRPGDVKDVGGVKNALAKYFELVVQRLPVATASQTALRGLIGKLYTSHADGSLSRDLVSSNDLKTYWRGGSDPVEMVVNQAADNAGIFEIQQLFISGESDVYVSLAQDSLATLGKSIDSERELHAYGRTKIYDTLWIMIPLAFLCAALAFAGTRFYFNRQAEVDLEKLQKIAEVNARALLPEKTRRPLYLGQLAQAQQALQAENALYARQILVSQPALRSYSDKNDFNLPDLRGFEWGHLWHALHSERHLFEGQRGGVNAVAVSPNGKWAASAGAASSDKLDGTIRVWDLSDGKLLALVPGKRAPVHALAFAPDGKTLASAGADKLVRLWDLSGLKNEYVEIAQEAKTLNGHTDTVFALVYGKDAQTLASAGADKNVINWDVAAGKEKHVLKEHAGAVRALAFSADDKTLASAGDENQIVLWDAGAGKKSQVIKTNYQAIAALALASDGKTLASGGVETRAGVEMGTIRFWTLADAKEAKAYKPIQHGAAVRAIAFDPDDPIIRHGRAGTDPLTPAELTVVSAGSDHVIRSFDAKTGTQVQRWIGHLGAVNALAFAKNADALVSGSSDGTAKAWNARQSSGQEVIRAHDDWVQCLALHPKNKLLASGARDGTVKLWDPAGARLLKELPKQQGAVTSLAFSNHPQKTLLAVGTRNDKDEGEIKILEIDTDAKGKMTAKETATLKEHKKGITCLAFHPHADRADLLISGSADATVKLWNMATGKAKSYAGHKGEVRSVAFTLDGKGFGSGGKDSLVCIYELDRDDIWTIADLHLNSVEAITFLPLGIPDDDPRDLPVHLLTASADLSMKRTICFKLENGQTHYQANLPLRPHAQPISAVLFAEEPSSVFASAGWDGAIKLYDKGGETLTLLGHQGPVRALAMAANQSFLVSAGNDGTLRFWRSYQERREPKDAAK